MMIFASSTVQATQHKNTQRQQAQEYKKAKPDFQIYDQENIGRPYMVIGRVIVTSYSAESVLKQVKKIALKNGADSVVGFHIPQTGTKQGVMPIIAGGGVATAVPTTSAVIIGEGVVVRWPGPNEKGIMKIDPNVAMPILQ